MTIVLLPGMDSDGSLFSEFVASLPADIECIIVAYPSDKALGYGELETYVAERLPRKPFILVGESFSGPIAIALAAAAPVGLRGRILVGSFARTPVRVPAFVSRFPLWQLPVRVVAAVSLGNWSAKVWRDRLASAMGKVTPAVWHGRLRAVLAVDVVSSLRAVSVPVLYLRGRSDRVVALSAWKPIGETLPAARLVELEGPHFLLQANPEESAVEVARFAKTIGVEGQSAQGFFNALSRNPLLSSSVDTRLASTPSTVL